MFVRIVVPLLVLAGTVPSVDAAPADHPSALLFLVRVIDRVPTKAQLTEAGAGPRGEALLRIASDRSLRRYARSRAAGMAGHFDAPQTRRALRRLVAESDDTEVRLQALVGITHLEGAGSRALLIGLLEHEHPELRAGAARGLVRIKAREAGSLIADRAQRESVPWVKSALQRLSAPRR